MHHVRVPVDHRKLAIVERDRDVDAAQIACARRILHHFQMRVAGLREQLREYIIPLHLRDPEQLWP
jgi:hypothetical protein